MDVALAILGVAFAVFVVWLAVRIVNRRERWAKWTAVALAVVVAYPLSLFPIAWLETREMLSDIAFVNLALPIYRAPAYWLAGNGPEWIGCVIDLLDSYATPID